MEIKGKMDNFSLEKDDCDNLFITQSSNSNGNSQNSDVGVTNSPVLGHTTDFQRPCFSLLDSKYSDISEDQFDIPCAQKRSFSDVEVNR